MMQIRDKRFKDFILTGITNEQIRSRNFAGAEKRSKINPAQVVNSAGRRNFCIELTPEVAQELIAYGCDVKYTRPRDANDEPKPFVQINLSYMYRAPEVHEIANGVDNVLDEAHVEELDRVEFGNLELLLEIGKEKMHNDGTKYRPLFANFVWAEIVPNYFQTKLANLRPPYQAEDDSPFDVEE